MSHATSLDPLFNPRSVAIVGASGNNPWTRLVVDTLRNLGFDGSVFYVNRRGGDVMGEVAYTSCSAIGKPVDAAFVAVPAAALEEALDDIADAGIRFGVVVSSGFAETGGAGATEQERIFARAANRGLRLLGPNSLGAVNLVDRSALSALPVPLPVLPGGRIALISQSGATAGLLAQQAHRQNIGLSHIVALGNEAMIDLADVLAYAVEQPSVKAIALFAETIRRPERFLAVAERALELRKPIVVLKVGSSPLTAEVAQAHTGALVGDDRVFNAVCAQYGLVRVESLEQLLVTASVLAHLGPLEDKGFAAVSISGGACEVMADAGSAAGVRFTRFAPATLERLKGVLAEFGAAHNPLDITGAAMAKPEMLKEVLEILGQDPDVGLLGCTFDMPSTAQLTHTFSLAMLDNTLRGFASAKCPTILLEQTMKDTSDHARSLMTTHEVPFLAPGIDSTMRAISHAYTWSSRLHGERSRKTPVPALSSERPVTERAALDYLASHGVPVIPATVVRSADEAFEAATHLAGAVALKILSPDIFHKTEVGGVALDIRTPEQARKAYEEIMASVSSHAPNARIEGVIVSPMRTNGIELFVGVAKDPMFGPVLAVGLGGIWVEAMSDTSLRLLPVEARDVKEMLGELKAKKILEGYRGAPPVDLNKLSDVIAHVGNAALALGEDMATLEVNPMYVRSDTIEALDALVVWRNAG